MFRRDQCLRVLLRWEYAGAGRLHLTRVEMSSAYIAQCSEYDLTLSVGLGMHWSVVGRPEYTVVWVLPDVSVKQTRMLFDHWLRGPPLSPNEGAVFDEICRALAAGESVTAEALHGKTLLGLRNRTELVYVVEGAISLTAFGEHIAWLRDHTEAEHKNPHAAQ